MCLFHPGPVKNLAAAMLGAEETSAEVQPWIAKGVES